MAVTKQEVTQLYVATFNRAPDANGLNFWVNAGMTIEDIASTFFLMAETQAKYPEGTTDEEFVTTIYQNVFGRDPEQAGLDFWVGEGGLGGGVPRSEMILTVIGGAAGVDLEVLNNKTEVGLYYADEVGENHEDGYKFSLADITDDPDTVASAKSSIDDLVGEIPEPSEPGELFVLTGAADRLTGTDKDDTFEAYTGVNMLGNDTNTLNSADVLDGEAGRDQLWADIFMGSSNILTSPRPIEFRSTEVEEMYFNAREMFMDGLITGPVQMIPGSDEVMDILPQQWQVVTVNGRQLLDVDYIESYYSDVDLKVYGLTTNKSDGGTAQFSDMTISMDHTSGSTANTQSQLVKDVDVEFHPFYADRDIEIDKLGYGYYIDGALKPSSMKVLFEQNYLIPGERAESQAIYYLLDQDADLFNVDVNGDGIMDPLANINTNGLRFTVDGGAVGVLEFDKQLLLDKQILNWDDFVDALQPALAQAIADGLLPADTTLTVDNTLIDFTFLDDGSRSVDIPAMVLETNTEAILDSVGFKWVEDFVGEYNVYGRLDNDAETAPEPLIINIELEKVGRQADGGGMVVGGDNYTKGFDQFDVYVKGEKVGYIDESSSLAYLLTTPHDSLDTMNIYTHPDYIDNPADLTIGNSNTPVYSILDVNHLDATDFLGILNIYFAAIQAPGNYLYELTDQGDTFQMFVVNDALNTTDSSLKIDAGTGDNTVHVDYLYSNGTVNDAVDGSNPDSDDVNTLITTYGGNDVVVLSNMGLETESDFGWDSAGDEDQDGSGDEGSLMIARADGARINTGAGNDAIFLNSHLEWCSPDAALWHTLNWTGTGEEGWLESIGLTNLPPWLTEENWAPAGNVFPMFGSSLRVTFSGIESDWITIDTNNDYKTTRAELVAAIAKAIETDVNLNAVLAVDIDPATGGISIQALTGGAFDSNDLFVDIEGPVPSISDYDKYIAGGAAGYDPTNPDFYPYFPGSGDVNQMTAQQLVSAWKAYYPGSDVSYDSTTFDIENKAGTGPAVFDSDANSNWFGTPADLDDFLAAVQANAETTEDLINAALFENEFDNDGSPASAGIQFVNAGPGHDTIVLPSGGITTVEFTGKFDTTTIISDGILGNLRFDFSDYLDTISGARGASINDALNLNLANGNDVLDGFCPIPTVAAQEFDGVENAADWIGVGGGQHNSVTYFQFSDLWSGLQQAYASEAARAAAGAAEDLLGNLAALPSDSFASFGAAELESALNMWLDGGDFAWAGTVRQPEDYFDRNLAQNLGFDNGGLSDVLGATFVILVGKDGEVIQSYDDGSAAYADAYNDWAVDTGYATGEVKVFTAQIARTADDDAAGPNVEDGFVYHFDNVELKGLINLGISNFGPAQQEVPPPAPVEINMMGVLNMEMPSETLYEPAFNFNDHVNVGSLFGPS